MSKLVLTVDDSRLARLMIIKTLKPNHEDWEFDQASSGEEAVKMASEKRYDLFFVDFNMEGMNGVETIAELRKDYPDTPIALVTANVQASVQDASNALNVTVIGKPVTPEKLNGWVTESNI